MASEAILFAVLMQPYIAQENNRRYMVSPIFKTKQINSGEILECINTLSSLFLQEKLGTFRDFMKNYSNWLMLQNLIAIGYSMKDLFWLAKSNNAS